MRRHYLAAGEHHTVLLEDKQGVLRARIDDEDADHAHVVDVRLVRRINNGAEIWITPGGHTVVVRREDRVYVAYEGRTFMFDVVSDRPGGDAAVSPGDDPFAASPMTGVVLKMHVKAGEAVSAGDVLCVVEAMKMEFAIEAPRDVVVEDVPCAEGDRVDIGQVLVTFAPTDGDAADA
jgi:biotin carboxyl carrier protein